MIASDRDRHNLCIIYALNWSCSWKHSYQSSYFQETKPANKKKFASKMRSIVSAVKTAQRLEVRFKDNTCNSY